MPVLDPPSIPALTPVRVTPTPYKRSVESPTIETPIRAAERIIAQVNSCYCGHHRDRHTKRMVRVEGQLALQHSGCLDCGRQCATYHEIDEAYEFQRRVAHELRNLPT